MSTPTQTRHPWRATVRTAVAVVVALASLLPVIIAAIGVDRAAPIVAGLLAVAAGVTRVMALPQVNEFLERFVPWLAASTPPEPSLVYATDLVATYADDLAYPATSDWEAALAEPAAIIAAMCPVGRCGRAFEIPVTGTLYGFIARQDTGCIEVTRPGSRDVDDHIAAHRAAGEWPVVPELGTVSKRR